MKKNVGSIDKVVRILIALVVIVLYFAHVISGTWAVILLIVSAILLLTSFFGFCPIYWSLGMSSDKKKV
jgi:hypothetical protein